MARAIQPRVALWILVGVTFIAYLVANLSVPPPHEHVPGSPANGFLGRRHTASSSDAKEASTLDTLPDSPTLPLILALANFSLVPPTALPDTFDYVICATPTHEGPFLVEWLTWHRLVGIQRFYLFDNSPSPEMRELLRPWLEEGSVVLYELDYPRASHPSAPRTRCSDDGPGVMFFHTARIPLNWQRTLMTQCEKLVLPRSSWVIHIDADEFLRVSAPGWSSPLPAFDPQLETWEFPLHRVLKRKDLARAACVPVPRIAWFNLGVREWREGMLVVETHLQREVIKPGRISHGKVCVCFFRLEAVGVRCADLV